MYRTLIFVCIFVSSSAIASSSYDKKISSRCEYITEVYARLANHESASEFATQREKDSAISLAAFYKTINYLMVYSSEGESDTAKTEQIIENNRTKLYNELQTNKNLIQKEIVICEGLLLEIALATQDEMDKLLGEGFFQKSYDIDLIILKSDIAKK